MMKKIAFFLFVCSLLTACKKEADLSELTEPADRPPFFVSGKIQLQGDTAESVFEYRTGEVFKFGPFTGSGVQENYLVANSILEDINATYKTIAGTLESQSERVFYLAFENPDSLMDGFSMPQLHWSKPEIEAFFSVGKTFTFDHVTLLLAHQDQLDWREDSSVPADNQNSFVRVTKIEDLQWTEDNVPKSGKIISFDFQCRIASTGNPTRVFDITEGKTTLYLAYE